MTQSNGVDHGRIGSGDDFRSRGCVVVGVLGFFNVR